MGRTLKQMKKVELMEMLLQQEKEIEMLRAENEELKESINDRNIKLEKAGSIAEAALQLSGIFEAAQKAADMYLNSVKPEAEGEEEIEKKS